MGIVRHIYSSSDDIHRMLVPLDDVVFWDRSLAIDAGSHLHPYWKIGCRATNEQLRMIVIALVRGNEEDEIYLKDYFTWYLIDAFNIHVFKRRFSTAGCGNSQTKFASLWSTGRCVNKLLRA
jgi:hypothetical protein